MRRRLILILVGFSVLVLYLGAAYSAPKTVPVLAFLPAPSPEVDSSIPSECLESKDLVNWERSGLVWKQAIRFGNLGCSIAG